MNLKPSTGTVLLWLNRALCSPSTFLYDELGNRFRVIRIGFDFDRRAYFEAVDITNPNCIRTYNLDGHCLDVNHREYDIKKNNLGVFLMGSLDNVHDTSNGDEMATGGRQPPDCIKPSEDSAIHDAIEARNTASSKTREAISILREALIDARSSNAMLVARLKEAESQRDKLQAYKDFTHTFLTKLGVPNDPYPEATKSHGCRISGRLTWLDNQRKGVFPSSPTSVFMNFFTPGHGAVCITSDNAAAVDWVRQAMACKITAEQLPKDKGNFTGALWTPFGEVSMHTPHEKARDFMWTLTSFAKELHNTEHA